MKIRLTCSLALLALGLVAGCKTQQPAVQTHYDSFSGLRTDLLSDNILPTPGDPREVVWLNAARVFQNNRDAIYRLEVSYVARDEVGLLEIPAGQTLTLIVDGQPLKFQGIGSSNTRKQFKKSGQPFVSEDALYAATRADLQRIASARQVKVQVRGTKGLIDRDFGPENFQKFREFVTRAAL